MNHVNLLRLFVLKRPVSVKKI